MKKLKNLMKFKAKEKRTTNKIKRRGKRIEK